jgi:hypothetical protein
MGPTPHPQAVRDFFQGHFECIPLGQEPAKFTGYYLAGLEASYKKDSVYNTPVYEWPDDLSVLDLQDADPDLPKRRLWLIYWRQESSTATTCTWCSNAYWN